MTEITVAKDWTYKWNYVPGRKRDYFTIERDGMEVDCRVMGWLDETLEPTTKGKASYIKGRRWSYHNGNRDNLPEWFAMELPK